LGDCRETCVLSFILRTLPLRPKDLVSRFVILRRPLLASKDLGVPREHLRVFCANAKSRAWHASFTAATTREVKALKMPPVTGSLGVLWGMSALKSTGSSIWLCRAHDHHRPRHFLPLLTT
jgi:hypothetical protein